MLSEREDEDFEAKLARRLLVGDDDAEDTLRADSDTADVTAMTEALRSYRAEALDWAEQRSATMPSPLPPGERARRDVWWQAPQWALGTVALCGCVIGGALYTHHQATLVENAAAVLPMAPTPEALVADNQLLSLVDTAVHVSVEPSEQELGLTNNPMGKRVQTHRHAQQREN